MKKSIQAFFSILFIIQGSVFAGSIKMRKSVNDFKKIATLDDQGMHADISKNDKGEYCLEFDIYTHRYNFPKNQAGKWFTEHVKNCITVRCEDARLGFPFTFHIKPEFFDKTSIKNVKSSMLNRMKKEGLLSVDQFIRYPSIKIWRFSYVLYTTDKQLCYEKIAEIYGPEALNLLKTVN